MPPESQQPEKPEQKPTLQEEITKSEEPAQRPTDPVIRTMKTDVAVLFNKKDRPSLSEIVGAEVRRKKRTARNLGMEDEKKRRLLPLLIIGLIVVAGGAGAYFFLLAPGGLPGVIPDLPPSPPLFKVKRTETLIATTDVALVRQIGELMRDERKDDSVTQLDMQFDDGSSKRYATLGDFLRIYDIMMPENILVTLDEPMTLFIHHPEDGNRIGFAIHTNDPDRTLLNMLTWELELPAATQKIFFGIRQRILPQFIDRSYRNLDWRYASFSNTTDVGIGYMVFPTEDILIFATSEATLKAGVEGVFGAVK